MKITIRKIAELTGVSRGTVDKVLHDRPVVSAMHVLLRFLFYMVSCNFHFELGQNGNQNTTDTVSIYCRFGFNRSFRPYTFVKYA